MNSAALDAPLTVLAGVGPARSERLARLGLQRVRDLLLLVPRRLEDEVEHTPLADLARHLGTEVLVRAEVRRTRFSRFGKRSTLRVRVADGTGEVDVLVYNQPWLRERFAAGDAIEVRGRVVDGPHLQLLRLSTPTRPLLEGVPEPVYPSTDGLSQTFLRDLCRAALEEAAADLTAELRERLSPANLAALDLPDLAAAVRGLHVPRDRGAFERARRRVALEPVLAMQARLRARREGLRGGGAQAVPAAARDPQELLARLPFEATGAQRAALDEVLADLGRDVPMRRLLQGDVGSGKTAVAVLACLAVARAGGQAAFLAPTEILAEQHYHGLRGLLAAAGLSSELLTGSLRAPARRALVARLASGELDLVFGTHALLGGDATYRRLTLAVVDEQHRFGVDQRRRLLEKGAAVHALYLSATPIPRTLALSVYGDLEVSVLREKPPGRGTIATHWIRGARLRRLRAFLAERLEAGERVFWVCARIEGDDAGAVGAEERFERACRARLDAFGAELVHGRMDSELRARRLDRFRAGTSRLLVATTLVEVGVDVPEATVMVVEDAERLGLAQLHQLRGRVGRGTADAWFLMIGKASGAERFRLLESTNDGFDLAEEDLRLRGMGDLAGLRQSGDPSLSAAFDADDVELLLRARELVHADDALYRAYLEEPRAVTP